MLIAAAWGCSEPKGWEISGEIADAAGQKVAVEGFHNGNWYLLDSVAVGDDCSFCYQSAAAAAYPEVMRISLNGKSIYFPVDSIDAVKVTTSAATFGREYTLSGSVSAVTMHTLDSLIIASVDAKGVSATVTDKDLKNQLFRIAFDDPTITSLYYLMNKSVGSAQLYNLSDPSDLRLYGAVAQRFTVDRPDDPRTAFLTSTFQKARAAASSTVTEIAIPESSLIDIVKQDETGRTCSLSEAASKGNVLILNFISYNIESSPEYNVLLNSLWEKYHASGLDIYQISFDTDETSWAMSAANLPWTTVWNTTTGGSDVLIQYNVGAIPMSYVINRQGEIAARITNPEELEQAIRKYL